MSLEKYFPQVYSDSVRKWQYNPMKHQLKKIFLTIGALSVLVGLLLASKEKHCQSIIIQDCNDGDTCRAAELGRMRLVGIDAPEIGQAFAIESRDFLRNKIKAARKTCVVSQGKDRYNRELVVIIADDQVLNIALIEEGLAEAYFIGTPWSSYVDAQKKARSEKKGMWSQKNYQKPSSFRKSKKQKLTVYPVPRKRP
jgi:micrococcal nuclease